MSENKSTIGQSIGFCLTFGIICTLIGLIIIFVSRLIILKNPFKCNIVFAFWIGLAPILFVDLHQLFPKKVNNVVVKDYDYIYTAPNKIELMEPLGPCPNEANWPTSHSPVEATWTCGVETPQSTPSQYRCYNNEEYPLYLHGEPKAENKIFILSDVKDKIINNRDYGFNAINIRIHGLRASTGWGELRPMKLQTQYDIDFWFWAHLSTCIIAAFCWAVSLIPGKSLLLP